MILPARKRQNLEKEIAETDQSIINFARTMTAVNRLSEEQQAQISAGYVKQINARASYNESTIRAQTTINSLTAKQGDLWYPRGKKRMMHLKKP